MQTFMVGQMLKRNMGVKPAPERWQDSAVAFDVVVTFEERIMEQLLDGGCFVIQSRRQCSAIMWSHKTSMLTVPPARADLNSRPQTTLKPVPGGEYCARPTPPTAGGWQLLPSA